MSSHKEDTRLEYCFLEPGFAKSIGTPEGDVALLYERCGRFSVVWSLLKIVPDKDQISFEVLNSCE
jgi:hypothetical protein